MPTLRLRHPEHSYAPASDITASLSVMPESDETTTMPSANTLNQLPLSQGAKSSEMKRIESACDDQEMVTASRKRRRAIDDEETELGVLNNGIDTNPLQSGQETPQEIEPDFRFVLLTVKTSSSTFLKLAVQVFILEEIPEYSKKLDTAKMQAEDGKRLRVTDSKVRKEEAMIHVVEYLTSGTLEPIDVSSPKACMNRLNELIDLYDLSVALKIEDLEEAIVDHITICGNMDSTTFIRFANQCYNRKKNDLIAENSMLGQFIKRNLAERLDELISTGAVDKIKNTGGTLSKQLVEVLAEKYLAITRHRK